MAIPFTLLLCLGPCSLPIQNSDLGTGLAEAVVQEATVPAYVLRESPQDLRLYPRNAQGFGQLQLAGDYASTVEGQFRLEVVGENGFEAVDMEQQGEAARQPSVSSRAFSLSASLPAGLVSYEAFLVWRTPSQDTIVQSWEGIVVGDVLLIHGQSNAVAADYYDEQLSNPRDQSYWIRSYGTTSQTPSVVMADQAWYVADGQAESDSAAVGVWALHLARRIVEEDRIPVALINGAVGGTTVAQHQRDAQNPTNLNTIYGRLLWRTQQAQVATKARALLWYQGESDGANAQGWLSGFEDLLRDWHRDFPGLEHLWLVQVRRGCGSPSLELRDQQRRLPLDYPNMHQATANGLLRHDGCHFRDEGYLKLAQQLVPSVAKHLYSRPVPGDIEPPDILSATWASPAQDSLYLDFRNVTAPLDVPYNSWNTLTVSDGVHVQSVSAVGNRLLVSLAGPSQASSVSFQGHAYNSPEWIRNSRGLAMMSFDRILIQ